MSNEERAVRLECLRLAQMCAAHPGEVCDMAEKFIAFVEDSPRKGRHSGG